MNRFNGLIISFIAGISTTLGYFSIYMHGKKENIISKVLYFSSGVMITLSIIDLIPSGIKSFAMDKSFISSFANSILYFFIGFICCYIFEKIFKKEENLYNVGIISMLGIIIHNIPEGIATYVLSTINLKLGIILGIAVMLHNIPEGICIAIPIYYSTFNKQKAFLYTFISGISEFIGAFLSMLILYRYIDNGIMGILYSIIAGIMIYISLFELIKTSKKYDSNNLNIYIFIGSIFILCVEIITKL